MTANKLEKITVRKFLIFFASAQTKAWLASEFVNDRMLTLSDAEFSDWAKLAADMGFDLVRD